VASDYPGSLDSFDTIASDKKTSDSVGGRTHRQMHNDLGDAIEAVQAELGTNPSGSDATVAARLSAIEAGTNLATGAVTSAKIADGTITATQIAANAVGSSELADNAVDTAAIADSAVTSAKIADGTITATQIAANAVGSSELADNAVDTAAIADSAVTSAKIADGTIVAADVAASTFAAFGTVGNLLTANQASGGDASGGTTGFLGSGGATIARSTAAAASGFGCIAMTSTAASGGVRAGSGSADFVNVAPGETVTASVASRAATDARTVSVLIHWYKADGSASATTGTAGGTATNSTSAWTTHTLTATVPSDAYRAAIIGWVPSGMSVGEVHYFDNFLLARGAAGVWAMPGTPIVGGSHIATNGAVHLSGTGSPEGVVTATPGSTWLQTDSTTDVKGWIRWVKATGTGNTGWVAGPEADTGNRNVGSLLVNGWTAGGGFINLSRLGNLVTMHGVLEAAAATATTALTLPSGFRPRNSEAYFPVQFGLSPGTSRVMEIGTSGVVKVYSYGAGTHYAGLTFRTNEAWPSSLPGSAA
jgi:hypothetical protein